MWNLMRFVSIYGDEILLQKKKEIGRIKSEFGDKGGNNMHLEDEKLCAYITHELGNHLALIRSTAQLMEKRNPRLHEIEYWDQLRADIETLGELFLDFSKCRQGDQLERKETDLIDLADETIESFQTMAEQKKITVTLEEEGDLDLDVLSYLCDSVKIRLVISNLIKNGMEALKEGEKIWVRVLGKKETGSDFIRIEVANNGVLIPKEELETIFQFGTSTKGKNRGIGLALSQKIVKSHNGKLEVSSEEVNGERKTVFSICLPV